MFARFGEKPIKIWNFGEIFKIYIQKSQWKIDFWPIFSPIFQVLRRMLEWEWVVSGLGGRGGMYKSLPILETNFQNANRILL